MPYYLHAKESEPNVDNDPSFLTRENALQAFDPTLHRITYVESEGERDAWRTRERDRFSDGEYVEVPWHAYTYNFPDHYAHLSIKSPGLIAYTKNTEHGYLDRQTSVRPGRYLQEYYRDKVTSDQIAEFIALCDASHLDLKIATTPADIRRVYIGGPRSCMSHWASKYECACCKRSAGPHYDYASYHEDIHPVEAYGNSDLALAYYGDIDHVSARCVIWPEKKIFSDGAAYGADTVLYSLLEKYGYSAGDVDGAKIRAIDFNGTYIVPYVDGASYGHTEKINGKEWIVIGNSGKVGYGHTSIDLSNCTGIGGDVEDDHDNQFYCDGCNEWIDEDDYAGESLCNSCYSDQYGTCEHCNENILRDRLREGLNARGNSRSYCPECYSELYTECTVCGDDTLSETMQQDADGESYCSECFESESLDCAVCAESFNPRSFSQRETESRERNNLDSLCAECESTHVYCSECKNHYLTPEKVTTYAPEVIFPSDTADQHTDGIYLSALAVPDTSYRTVCSECKRDIRPAGQESLISVIDTLIGADNLLMAADTVRESLAGRTNDDLPESYPLPVWREWCAPNANNPRYWTMMEYRPNPYASYNWPYSTRDRREFRSERLAEYRAYVESLLQADPIFPLAVYKIAPADSSMLYPYSYLMLRTNDPVYGNCWIYAGSMRDRNAEIDRYRVSLQDITDRWVPIIQTVPSPYASLD